MEIKFKQFAQHAIHGVQICKGNQVETVEPDTLYDCWLNVSHSGWKIVVRPLTNFGTIGWYDEDENSINVSQYNNGGLFLHNILESNDVPIKAVIDLIEQLLEQHYDIFGLIPQNLAIDIDTLGK